MTPPKRHIWEADKVPKNKYDVILEESMEKKIDLRELMGPSHAFKGLFVIIPFQTPKSHHFFTLANRSLRQLRTA